MHRAGKFRKQTKADPCHICGVKSLKRKHAVDHDHETGQLRGRLCVNCNVGLGHFGDSIERLQAAQEYLKRAQEARRIELEQLGQDIPQTLTWDSVGPILGKPRFILG